MSLICTRTQEPAGQGGFHTGQLEVGGASLRYIYDCGSTKQAHIDDAIESYVDGIRAGKGKPTIDFLFISHFDSDHISGLAKLLERVHVKQAVIPYIDDFERLYLYGAESEGGRNEGFRAYMSHPYEWWGNKGVEQIVVIGGDSDVGPRPFDGDPQDRPVSTHYSQIEHLAMKPRDMVRFSDSLSPRCATTLHYIHHSSPLQVVTEHGVAADWSFLTYVHPWEEKRTEFKNLVQERLIVHVPYFTHLLGNDALAGVLEDPECVKILTECYNIVWKGAKQKKNATTLSLYSGPYTPNSFLNRMTRGDSGSPCRAIDIARSLDHSGVHRAGWLLTGDAALKEKVRRNPFLSHYEPIRHYVGTLMLPHHGSNANFHQDLLSYFNAPIYSMAAGMTKHHPHATVLREACVAGLAAVTSDKQESAMTFRSELLGARLLLAD